MRQVGGEKNNYCTEWKTQGLREFDIHLQIASRDILDTRTIA
jgi:hypothetical protein